MDMEAEMERSDIATQQSTPHLFCFSFSDQFWLGNLGMDGGGGGF